MSCLRNLCCGASKEKGKKDETDRYTKQVNGNKGVGRHPRTNAEIQAQSLESLLLPEDDLRPNHQNAAGRHTRVLEALASNKLGTQNDLDFQKGDKIEIENVDNAKTSWIRARNLRTQESGYIDLTLFGDDLEAQPWYFGDISFYEARVLLEGSETGTYLIRRRPYDPSAPYCLSIKVDDHVKNYKIFEEDSKFCISEGCSSDTLQDLISAYINDTDQDLGLPIRLREPCEKLERLPTELSSDFRDRLEIERSEIIRGERIGRGVQSEVCKGQWKDKAIAVKVLSQLRHDEADFMMEVAILKRLRHRNIVQFYGISTQQQPYYIVMEFMKFGDLQTYLKDHSLEEFQRIHIAAQVAEGMSYLESQGVIHRDLAARNVLLQDKLTAKISDFGLSRIINDEQLYFKLTERQLPLKWLAPEAIGGVFSSMSDVWAFGIVLIEIYTRKIPYGEFRSKERIHQLFTQIKQGYREKKPDNMPDVIYEKCTNCWIAMPNLRPSFKELSGFFRSYVTNIDNSIR